MPDSSRRKRFQIHLSTAIVMMFVAGGLMWANFLPRELVLRESDVGPGWIVDYTYRVRGWPFHATQIIIKYETIKPQDAFLTIFPDLHIDYLMAALDTFIAISILCAVWFFCEWLICHFDIKRRE